MKKVIFGISIILGLCSCSCRNSIRAMSGSVFSQTLVETDDGMLWKYDTDFECGSSVLVYFDTNGTLKVEDDVIISIKEW